MKPNQYDVNLFYFGGSGGFLLLHLLLLSKQFYVAFRDHETIDQVIEKQWQISDHTHWKQTENWPINASTLDHPTELRKIYFYCNPYRDIIAAPGKTAMLYTDYHSQHQLSYYKRCFWHLDVKAELSNPELTLYLKILREWKKHYDNLKDPLWPRCVSFRHINRLPAAIQQELLNDPYTKSLLDKQFNVVKYHNDIVYKPAERYLNSADIVVKLQDIVNSDGQILVDAFDIPAINSKQKELLARWRSLHPSTLLSKIGIAHK